MKLWQILFSARKLRQVVSTIIAYHEGGTDFGVAAVVQILKKIIDKTWAIELLDATKLAKYIRCLFQIALSDDVEVAEQLLDQVCGYASEAAEVRYPLPTEKAPADMELCRLISHGHPKNSNGWPPRHSTTPSTSTVLAKTTDPGPGLTKL